MSDAVAQLNTALEGRYAIERELGQGGMATVYLARDLRHDRHVALKVLKPELAAAVGAERFLAEIRLTARLQHPHILPLHDSGESDGTLYYVMPFAEGEALREQLDREKKLPIDEAIAITRAVAGALDYAHRHEIIHRDIKPENILIHDGEAVVADFGIALAVDAAGPARLTAQGVSIGTPMYMSPEQATGEPVDGRADIYSLASVLYEMLTGQSPYADSTLQALVAKLLTEPPVHPRLLRDTVSEELDGVIMKALAKVPADRFPTAGAFAEALVAAAAPVAKPGRRVGPLAAVISAAAIAVVGIATYAGLGGGPTATPSVREERQLTFDGSVQGATLSPAGDFFSYITNDGTNRRLYVKEVGGGNAILLDSLQGVLCCTAWSPDGLQIAYQRGSRSEGSTVVTARLGGPRREIRAEIGLAWSPDGSRMLSWWPAAKVLTITDVSSGAVVDSVPLGSLHDWVHGADWSPDGEYVTVSIQDSAAVSSVRTVALDGRVIEDLTADTASITSPRWARDGSGIYYLRGDEVWKIDVSDDGRSRGGPRLLVTGAEASVLNVTIPSISISGDGARLLYNKLVGHSNLWRFSGWEGDGGEPAERLPLTRGTAQSLAPRLSPDGQQLAYMEIVGGRASLFVMPAEGGRRRQLTVFERMVGGLTWSPDGSRIAVAAAMGGEIGLWLVDLESGRSRRAPLESFDGDELVWAPRSDIVYQVRDHTELRVVDPDTWDERVLRATEPGAWWYDLRLSLDGRGLFVRRTGIENGLWHLDLGSGDLRQLSESVKAPIGWGPDEGSVLAMIIDGRTDVAREVYRLSASGAGSVPYLTLPLGQSINSRQVTMSPDGQFLIASVPVASTDVWIVDNFDPR